MQPKKGTDHARVTLGTCGSGVPLAPEGRASEGRAGARGPPAPRLSPPPLRLRGPPGAGPPCLLAPSLALFTLVDLGLGTRLASQDHRPPDALPCGLRVSPGPTEVQVRVGRSISERHVGDSPCRWGPAGHPCPPCGRGRCPRGACELWGLSWVLAAECGRAPGSPLGAGLTLHLSGSQDRHGARVPALGPPPVPGGERTPRRTCIRGGGCAVWGGEARGDSGGQSRPARGEGSGGGGDWGEDRVLCVLSRRGVRKRGASGEAAWEGHELQALVSLAGVPCLGPGPVLVLNSPSAPGWGGSGAQ